MPRPQVETRNCRVTLSESQIAQVEKLMEHLGLSTLSEGLRYLITRGIQSELLTLTSVGNNQISKDFSKFVEMMMEAVELEKEGKNT